MSGIVGIFNLDGSPVNRVLLQKMTGTLARRCPDAQEIWVDGQIGLGHAMFHTTFESKHEKQPHSLDGTVWITADARIDDRYRLKDELKSCGFRDINEGTPITDVDLILYSYQAWGTDCVQHFLGDFAFAIWDSKQKHLFCARDHFGVRPLYYINSSRFFVCGSSIDLLKMHPDFSDSLDEQFIGDFLLFASYMDADRTVYQQLKRLPPAHGLTISATGMSLQQYWDIPTDRTIRYQHDTEYVDHFRETLRTAVSDRLRTDSVSFMMSGGTDSTAIAAFATRCLSGGRGGHAFTIVHEDLMPEDQEGYYASLVAKEHNFPITYLVSDRYSLYDRWGEFDAWFSEPCDAPLLSLLSDYYDLCASHSRVALTGLGGDPVLAGDPLFHARLLRKGHVLRFFADLGSHLWQNRTPKGFLLRTMMKHFLGSPPRVIPDFPSWIRGDFKIRLGLPERWEEYYHQPQDDPHAWLKDLLRTGFTPSFEFDCSSPQHLEVRHPFLDVRLINFIAGIAAYPWCRSKKILVDAVSGILPEPVRKRPKTPLPRDPILERLAKFGTRNKLDCTLEAVGEKYIDRDVYTTALQKCVANRSSGYYFITPPVSLERWLRRKLHCSCSILNKEAQWVTAPTT